ncbi:MAG: C-GCAxxG-C-C family protein [Candidatus Omnitrophota bacterium]
MNKVEDAVMCFKQGFNCAQALVSTYGPELGIDREIALKISAGFGAGMGRKALVCGAVSGACMIIGLKYGGIEMKDKAAKEKTCELVREFMKRFTLLNNSVICKELLSRDISTLGGLKSARDNKLIDSRCSKFVRDAAEIIEQIL